MTTPDLYPLSLNALVAAANQRSSRDPVMDLSEGEVRAALDVLEEAGVVSPARDGGRVVKFEHRIRTVLSLRRDETAVMCLLFLRGPQTPGELRSRADRMFAFEDLSQLQSTLERLAAREEPLVAALPRQPGSREVRWMHLLGSAQERNSVTLAPEAGLNPRDPREERPASQRDEALSAKVEALERRVSALEAQLERLLS